MRRFALPSLVALSALAVIVTGGATETPASEPRIDSYEISMVSTIEGVPTEALPRNGECRIWYDELPAAKQPRSMDCEHALWLARSWGGRVISTDGRTASVVAQFEGRNDFAGVPVEALPAAGYCRAWIDGVGVAEQPEQSDCVIARRTVRAEGGRVLFMPA